MRQFQMKVKEDSNGLYFYEIQRREGAGWVMIATSQGAPIGDKELVRLSGCERMAKLRHPANKEGL